jgi:nitrogen fixation NifU-like protein
MRPSLRSIARSHACEVSLDNLAVLPEAATQYSPDVREHFANPRNVGRFEDQRDVISATAGSAEQGAKFWLSARIRDDRIESVRYRVFGCPHCIAASSLVSEQLIGATVQQLNDWSWRALADHLSVPPEKRGRLLILEDAIRALAKVWRAAP